MEEAIDPLIDERNADLWKELRGEYDIRIEKGTEPGYLTKREGKRYLILVDARDLNPASFTHELLHLYMKSRGVLIAWDLPERIAREDTLEPIFSTSLKVHLGNCLEHVKMLPLFLERGFKNEDFLKGYPKKIMGEADLEELERTYYSGKKLKAEAVDVYIGKFFSMKASNDREVDYSHFFLGLKRLDPWLYEVLEGFWKEWAGFQIGDPREDYQEMLERFIDKLKSWLQAKEGLD